MKSQSAVKVLVVEDNPGDYFLVEEYLNNSEENFDILQASTLKIAVNLLSKDVFDVVLLDLSLPDSAGLESVKNIVEINPQLPIIVLTGYADKQYGLKSLKLGAEDYLVKDDINASLLIKSIHYSIERNLLKKEMVRQDRLFRVITETGVDAKVLLDTEGVILFCTNSVLAILGYESPECIGQNKKDLLHPHDFAVYENSIKKVIADSSLQPRFEARIINKSGGYTWCELSLTNLLNDPNVKAIVCSFWDLSERKAAEEKIALSERRFRSLVQKGADMIMIMDELGVYSYVSETVTTNLGYEANEMIGMVSANFLHPDDYEMAAGDVRSIELKSQRELKPFRYKHANGSWRWLETIITNLLDDPAVNGIVTNSRDVTEKLEVEKELEKLSIIARETTNAVIITDKDENITWVNNAYTKITGYSFEESLGKNPGILLQGEESDLHTISFMKKQMADGISFESEIINYTKSGEKYWVRIQCQPLKNSEGVIDKFFSIQTDITESKRSFELMMASEEKYRYLFDVTPAIIIIWDPQTFKVLAVNDRCVAEYGYTEAECRNMTLVDFRDKDEHADIYELLPKIEEKTKSIYRAARRHRTKDGKLIIVDFSTHLIKFNGKNAVLALAQNITEKTELENLLKEEQLKKGREITEAVITAQEREREEIGRELHDNVNQILAGSRLYLGMVKNEDKYYHPYVEETDKLIKNAIDELRNLSHSLIPPSLQQEAFVDAVDEMIKVITLSNSINIKKSIVDFKGIHLSDKMWLSMYRIIQEQFNNILKYAEATEIGLTISTNEDKLMLTITDNGKGFDTQKKSDGVGIINIRTRAALNNGVVNIVSSIGKGCQLEVIFDKINIDVEEHEKV